MATSTSQTQSSQGPWQPQQQYLESAFANAQNAYGQASQAQAPTNFTAGLTPAQQSIYSDMVGAGTNTGAATGETNAGASDVNAGSSGLSSALSSLLGFNPSATNNMTNVANGANTYANGINVNGEVANAMQSANEEASQVTKPMIAATAAGTGNTDSSRTAISQGLVDQGLAQQAANLSSTLQNQNYETGANLAANQGNTNTNAMLTALEGAGSAGSSLVNSGVNAMSGGVNNLSSLLGLASTGGSGLQSGNQDTLTNQLQQYESAVSSPYDALNGLMGIIGGSYGSQGTSTTQSTPSMLQQIGGIATGLGSLFKLCDRRYKEDIKRVGYLDDGTPVYTFRYKGMRAYELGVMAQELQEKRPDAVVDFFDTLMVNYGAL